MSLQTRLLAAFAVILVTFAITAVLIMQSQRDLLYDQIDDRLVAVEPVQIDALINESFGPPPGTGSGDPTSFQPPRSPLVDVLIAAVDETGTTVSVVAGPMITSEPNIAEAVALANGERAIVTVGATEGNEHFRVLVAPRMDGSGVYAVAQPLDEVESTLQRLQRTLVIAGGILVLMLGLIWFWIQRLGLRPIARVTGVAESIAHGDRTSRVANANPATEAGKLGLAFNLMLDERDAGEQRLRQFVADASHELRTPLTSIRGYLDLVRQGAFRETDQLDDVVRRMSAETSRMNELVQDLLVLASLDEGRPLRITSVSLGRLLEDAALDARAIQPERQIAVETEGNGPVIDGDESLLIQLVSILVSNALHHTTVQADVTLAARSDGNAVEMEIADTGAGMPGDVAVHVFDRFWRGDPSRARSAGGTGLGLAIAAQIVDRHHGTISLETALGTGCRFRIALPVGQPETVAG